MAVNGARAVASALEPVGCRWGASARAQVQAGPLRPAPEYANPCPMIRPQPTPPRAIALLPCAGPANQRSGCPMPEIADDLDTASARLRLSSTSLAMAFVGDVTPYDHRQPALGGHTGQITLS